MYHLEVQNLKMLKSLFKEKLTIFKMLISGGQKNGHKVEPVVKIGDTLPLEFAENYK